MSEIDDIFGNKKKAGKTKEPIETLSTTKPATKKRKTPDDQAPSTEPKPIKKKAATSPKKGKANDIDDLPVKKPEAEKKKEVETVVFAVPTARPIPPKKKTMDGDEDDGFANSRGSDKSTKRTEDGLRVFYNTDLQIGQGNGDTPQCPFDCWCCY
ncbi:hypothetical protein BCR33DRAFT_719174 [Rhizoclosmatium globosum]|uniref:DUF1764-domain-containing protein n=1 Tax=Rhizoclosmatium globosum TaxID=329046 RepID=A0A1Y2C2B3_9FUNG|nr:hypothetical protein BCR33DRAFT_719174 [Rhizoclosmatium globosum]|eukprot:ORY41096.1 hypothetical protein BCR33DRAFT_719174 [Rhizoclosmatium globosum]